MGTWIKLGLTQTENKFYNQTKWDEKKESFLLLEKNPNPAIKNHRFDLYEKIILNPDYTFTLQILDLVSDKNFHEPLKGTWSKNQDHLIIKSQNKDNNFERNYEILSHSKDEMELRVVKETYTEKGKNIQAFDYYNREIGFQKIIKQIGIDTIQFTALLKNEVYDFDYWEMMNFGNYQILSRRNNLEENRAKYNKTIEDFITEMPWDYLPYYDPIFEHTNEKLIFNTNRNLMIRYKMLSSGNCDDCGTLSENNFQASWQYYPNEDRIELNFNNKEEPPYEVLHLFRSNKLNSKNYKILAKNDWLMIWQKID